MSISKIRLAAVFLTLTSFFSASAQLTSNHIVTDQFGYQSKSTKIAVLRDPQIGFDAAASFIPGKKYAVVNRKSGKTIYTGTPVAWNKGATDGMSGDRAWWFDFSEVTANGSYYILDIANNVRSFDFEISDDIYREVLKHAVRTFYYQRAGYAKTEPYAGKGWIDAASFMGPLQDTQCRIYNDPENAATEKDVHGGWYDAGDLHRYTNWEANYVVSFMHCYLQSPSVWADDYNIPESGNGVPDLLDEAKWGLDHLLRLQNPDGSVISLVCVDHEDSSPPSKAKGRSVYCPPSTTSTLSTAGAYAFGAKVYRSLGQIKYADALQAAAVKAWNWGVENPAVLFKNNDAGSGTKGLGGGQQEVDDYSRFALKMRAACFLYDVTGDLKYKSFFEDNYKQLQLVTLGTLSPFRLDEQETLLYFTTLPGITKSVAADIKSKYRAGLDEVKINSNKDPYLSYIDHYGWGSNSVKCAQGLLFTDAVSYNIEPSFNTAAKNTGQGFLHYMHGVNPLNMVYLTNMNPFGAEKSATQIWHIWFKDGSALWDEAGVSVYGPPPGFVPGGANQDYKWAACCDTGTCEKDKNEVCTSEPIPVNEPPMKFYKDFNTTSPLNTWELTENSCSYQINYIHLLSKYVMPSTAGKTTKK